MRKAGVSSYGSVVRSHANREAESGNTNRETGYL